MGPRPRPDYRRKQVAEWLYAKRADSIAEMTNLPAALRKQLEDDVRFHRAEAGQAAGLARHDAEAALGIALRRLHRERADSRLARYVRRALRPLHALRFHPGRLRVWLQVLRERAGGLEAQPDARGDRRADHRDRARDEDEDQQPRLHGHGRAAGQLREPDAGAEDHQRALGRRHRRAAHHRFPPAASPRKSASWRSSRCRSGSRCRCTARPTRCASRSCR